MVSPPQHSSSPERAIGIDLMRGLAIALVLGLHLMSAHIVEPDANTIGAIELYVFERGILGVTAFFVISGFLITRTTIAREGDLFALSYRRFYLRRASRILPLLAISLALGIASLTLGAHGGLYDFVLHSSGAVFDASFWLSIATFTFNWARLALNHQNAGWGLHWDVLWSLAVEEQFYILFPVAALLARTAQRFTGILLGAIAIALVTRALIAWFGLNPDLLYMATPACLDALAIGILAVPLADTLPRSVRRLAMVAGLCFAAANYLYQPNYIAAPSLVAGGVALFLIGAQDEALFASPIWRPSAAIGELSYGIYLLHPIVLYLMAPLLQRLDFSVAYIVFLGATAMLAHFVYRYFERPAAAWIRAMPVGATAPRKVENAL